MAGGSATLATIPAHQRCTRSDGRSWRCKNPAADGGSGYCETHFRNIVLKRKARISTRSAEGSQGDGGGGKEEIMKMEGGNSKGKGVEKVYVRRRKMVGVEVGKADGVYSRQRRRKNKEISEGIGSPTAVNLSMPLQQCTIKKEDEDAVVAPFSPQSPNIGDSAHQQSLLIQAQPAPSASTSSMVIKKHEGSENMIAVARLQNLDIGSEVKAKRAKSVSRCADEFSVSKCAAVLNEMTGFTPEELVKASKVFVKPFNREMFLSLKDELRRLWLRSQISD